MPICGLRQCAIAGIVATTGRQKHARGILFFKPEGIYYTVQERYNFGRDRNRCRLARYKGLAAVSSGGVAWQAAARHRVLHWRSAGPAGGQAGWAGWAGCGLSSPVRGGRVGQRRAVGSAGRRRPRCPVMGRHAHRTRGPHAQTGRGSPSARRRPGARWAARSRSSRPGDSRCW